MKKKVMVVLISILCLTWLTMLTTVCSAEKITLTAWGWDGHWTELLKPLIAKFEKVHPNIKVKGLNMGYADVRDKMLITFVAGTGAPDVSTGCREFSDQWIYAGGLTDLTKEIGANVSLIHPHFADCYKDTKGRLWLIPFDAGPAGIFYRKDIFEKEGIDFEKEVTSWQEYVEVGKKITKDLNNDGKIDQYMLCLWNNALEYAEWVQGRGGVFSNLKGDVLFNNPIVIETYKWAADMILKSKIAYWQDNFSPAFYSNLKNNMFATDIRPYWFAGFGLQKLGYTPEMKGKWRLHKWLPWKKGDPPTGAEWGGSGMAIPKQSKHKKEALELIKFMCCREESQYYLATIPKDCRFPVNLAALEKLKDYKDPFFGGQQLIKIYCEQLEVTPQWRYGANQPIIYEALNRAMERIIKKGENVEKALKEAEVEAERERKF